MLLLLLLLISKEIKEICILLGSAHVKKIKVKGKGFEIFMLEKKGTGPHSRSRRKKKEKKFYRTLTRGKEFFWLW